jgi:hypothetical protein
MCSREWHRGGAWRGKAPLFSCVLDMLLPNHAEKRPQPNPTSVASFSILPQVFPSVSAIDRIISHRVGTCRHERMNT